MSEANGQQLPEGWATARLGDLGEYINGRGFKKSEWGRVGRPIIRIQDLTGSSNRPNYFSGTVDKRHVVNPGDFLISWAATLGAYIWKGPEGVLNQHIFKVQTHIDKRFHVSLVHRVLADMLRRAHGTGMVHITKGEFDSTRVPVPPLDEQLRIADALDELLSDLDAGVAALERVQAKLKHYRAVVLKAAVEGALTADWRAQHPVTEAASTLLPRILTERRRRWEEAQLQKFKEAGKTPSKDWKAKYQEPITPDTTNLPSLPDKWCWATLGQMTTGLMNGYGKRSQIEGIPNIVLRLADIVQGEISFEQARKINCTSDEVDQYLLSQGDLLFIRVNGSPDLVGRIILVRNTSKKSLFCDHFIRAKAVIPSLGLWLRAYGDTQRFRRFVDLNKVSSAGQNTISQGPLSACSIPLPPTEEQEAIIEVVEDQLSVIDHLEADLEAKLKSAQALRQSILRHAFTGQLVPQDPKDEPAAELLKRIAAQREELARQTQAAKKTKAKPKAPLKRAAKKIQTKGIS